VVGNADKVVKSELQLDQKAGFVILNY